MANRLDDARHQFCRALEINPQDEVASDDLEIVLDAQGKLDAVDARLVERRPDSSIVLEMDALSSYCPKDAAPD